MANDESASVAEGYRKVVAANLRAYRARRQLSQDGVAKCMRDLGFREWRRQTMSLAETGQRRIAVEELMALASVLDTFPAHLLSDSVS